jgi:hypothetical protein
MAHYHVEWEFRTMAGGSLQRLSERFAVQTAVYWANPVDDGMGGLDYDDPVEILCRWDAVTEVVMGKDGQEIVSRAKVIVTQDVDERGRLYLGTLEDLDSAQEAAPETVEGAYIIQRFDKTPGVRSTTDFFRVVYL